MDLTASFTERNELAEIRVGKVRFATGGGDLWTAVFACRPVPGTVCPAPGAHTPGPLAIRAGDAAAFEREENGRSIVLRWRDIPLGGERNVLDATVTIAKRTDGSLAWSLAFDNRSNRHALFSVEFPRLDRVTRDGEGDALLPSNQCDHGARLCRARRAKPRPEEVEYPAFSPMVCAFFVGKTGLYIAAEDSDARLKSFRVEGEQCVRFAATVENAGRPGLAAEGPRFELVLAPLEGDWWEAASRYRAFALRQKWAARGPIRDIPDYPRRLCEIPLWINIHAHPKEADEIRLRVKEVFPDFPTGIHWHLWQHSGHDENYPEYFPAQPGTAEVIAAAKADNQEMLPYANGRLWSVPTAGYEMARPFAVMKPDGTRVEETYHPATPPLAVMCPCCEPWQRVVRHFTGRILDELGAGSLFLDQIGAAPGVPCFDPSHNHPTGGGAWWAEGYGRLLDPIRRAANAHGAFVTVEGSNEYCLGMVDGYMQVTERKPEDVPFWNAVYSGYTTYFGSPQNPDDDPVSFRALQTRELFWGNALGWFLPEILDRPDKCEILRRLCAFRQANLDALAYGTLLDELRPVEPLPPVQCAWHGRRPNFGLFDKGFALPPALACEMPSVIGNWWRTAGGETVLLAANLADEERTVEYEVRGCGSRPGKTATTTLAPHELRRIPHGP